MPEDMGDPGDARQGRRFRRRLRGYDPGAVERELGELAADARRLTAERDELERDRTSLAEQLAGARERVAELEADRDGALPDARARADEIVAAAREERDRLRQEARHFEELRGELDAGYRAFLLTALELLEARDRAPEQPGATAGDQAGPDGA